MGYKELLSEMVEKSHMTLREIADMAREKGVSLDPSYISKLQTGKQQPASDEVSKVIAEVCGGDPDLLIWEGYMEKAPEVVRTYINKSVGQLKGGIKAALKMQLPKDELINTYLMQIDALSELEIVKEIINTEDFFETEDELVLVNKDDGGKSAMVLSEFIEMPDDSMVPLIPKGARISVKRQRDYNNGEVVVVKLSENKAVIRKIIFYEDKVILIPENTKYDTNILNKDEIEIGGKITSVIMML